MSVSTRPSVREPGDPGSRRLHVLHVAEPVDGGVAAVVLAQVRDQVERGWSVSVACPSTGPLGFAARLLGAEVHWWDLGTGTAGGVRAALLLAEVLAATGPDVVHLHAGRAGVVGRLVVRNRVPTLVEPHGHPAAARTERRLARWTTELVCATEGERSRAAALGMTGPASVLSPGVDLVRLQPLEERDRVLGRRALALPDVPTALCVGRLTVDKGQRDLLAAWPRVRAQVPDAALHLLGDGPDRPVLERLAAELEGARVVGRRSDVPTWYGAADVVVVPSRSEELSLVPLEAMASARSVVATRVPGILDTVPPGAGALVEVDDHTALADAVAERLTDPERVEDEGWAGRAHVEAHHDAAASANALARVYLKVLGARRR
ncbi:glycosyltransferase family 4 protein [Nocardioides sp. SYSU D00038]|uniref:glycosyltransferase family 4 protein n=1 Tax=Nocardioides sp. SYSU D00038 TaxID=2812554 RepID=UPI0019687FAE|nr:glycosyltransferase family 4 protein [Nocardioides sp. SYSU D00038]